MIFFEAVARREFIIGAGRPLRETRIVLIEPPELERDKSSWQTFAGDLSVSARVLKRAPALVLLTFALHLVFGAELIATELNNRNRNNCLKQSLAAMCHPHPWLGLIGLAYFLVSLFLIGFYGTQRVWFVRAQRSQDLDRRTVWRMTWSFFGRYLTMSFLFGVVLIPFFVASAIYYRDHPGGRLAFAVPFYVLIFVAEVIGTFVGAALAFSTRRLWVAIRVGVNMLIKSWPRAVWYAVAPPITLLVIGADFIRRSYGVTSALIVSAIVAPMLALWFKSATSLFYLRRVPEVGPDGAAFLAKRTCPNGHPVDKLALYCSECGTPVNERVYPG